MNSKNIIITVIIALIAGGAGFYGGTIYEKSNLNTKGLLRNAGNERPFGQGQGGPGQQGGQRPGAGGFARGNNGGALENGEITAKDDKSITIKTREGSSKIIFFSDSTSVGKTAQGSASDLSVGQQVMVNGQADPSGVITAQNIQIRPEQTNQ